jgi:CheY-like chemotaxis protein
MAKILVVDDDDVTIGLLCLYLANDQHDVTTAKNGRDALDCLRSNSFDILITDIIMPEMDGYELIMHLLLQPNAPKIIAISAGAPSLDAAQVLEITRALKVKEVLIKPVAHDVLQKSVNKLLQTA